MGSARGRCPRSGVPPARKRSFRARRHPSFKGWPRLPIALRGCRRCRFPHGPRGVARLRARCRRARLGVAHGHRRRELRRPPDRRSRTTDPHYLPDEYIYPSLARSLAEHGRPMIRGVGVHFPGLLDPLVTAPVWLVTNDPVAAYRLDAGTSTRSSSRSPRFPPICSAAGSASRTGWALSSPRSPSRFRTGSTRRRCSPTRLPIRSCSRPCMPACAPSPSRRFGRQLAFAVFSGLTVVARIQYAVVPVAVVGAEIVADRCNVFRLVAAALARADRARRPAGAAARDVWLGSRARRLRERRPCPPPGSVLHWAGREAMLLTYAGGWAIIPGALAGIAVTLFRPQRRVELAFAVTTLLLGGALLLEAAQIADTDSQRFQERYLFSLVPLLAIAFALYVKRGLPWRIPVGLASAALLLLAARVPLSGYAAAHNKDDSPTLWAVLRLEGFLSVGNGSLAIALIAAALSVRRRARGVPQASGRACARPRDRRLLRTLRGRVVVRPAESRSLRTRCPPTCAGSTTPAWATSTCSRRPARARSSPGSSSSGTRPSSGSSCSAARRSTSSTRSA